MGIFSFFQSGERTVDHIEGEVLEMVASCRHSLDLAVSALITDADIAPIGDEVRSNDRSINAIEESVRRELVVHCAVSGSDDIGAVLAFLLVVKKLERVGDQAKNIFDLADEGVRFSDAPDYADLVGFRDEVSHLYADVGAIIRDPETHDATGFFEHCETLMRQFDGLVNELLHSPEPGSVAVPRAMYYRYLKRIVANLASVTSTLADGIDRTVDLDE